MLYVQIFVRKRGEMEYKTLKQLRKEKGLTQIETSKLLNMSYQNYRFYESGYYKAMSEELEIAISELMNYEYKYRR